LRRQWEKAVLAAGLVGYLRDPLAGDRAADELRGRLQDREGRFLRLARESIFGDPRSPHGWLLRAAGWDAARLERAVSADGLEATLDVLRRQEVWTSLAEFTCREPIRRGSQAIAPDGSDFDTPRLRGRLIRGATSGTWSRRPSRVAYDWDLFAEEAALECLLFESHGILDAPWALWLPGPPSVSGIHNLLVHLRFRRPPERWFSHLPADWQSAAALRYIRATARGFGMRVPLPEPTAFEEAESVARWLASARDRAGRAVLKAFASSATRVAEAARQLRIDLRGCLIFAGGESLTPARIAHIRATGATVFARYVATETGWIASACPFGDSPDAMHVFTDRLAVLTAPADSAVDDDAPLLFTTLSAGAGKILLNTDLGDSGRLRRRPCGCPMGHAGLNLQLSGVHSQAKLSIEGITVAVAVITRALDRVVAAAGGPPDSYQLRQEEDGAGARRLVVRLGPALTGVDDGALLRGFFAELPRHGPDAKLAARFWRESSAIAVRRGSPTLSDAHKMRPLTVSGPDHSPRFDVARGRLR